LDVRASTIALAKDPGIFSTTTIAPDRPHTNSIMGNFVRKVNNNMTAMPNGYRAIVMPFVSSAIVNQRRKVDQVASTVLLSYGNVVFTTHGWLATDSGDLERKWSVMP
jgi:hypothetical protein